MIEAALDGSPGGDLSIVNLARARRGLPRASLRWVCQHSCAEASIPDCEDPRCEAMTVVDEAHLGELRALAGAGDWRDFEATPVALRIAAPDAVVRATARAAAGLVLRPGGERWEMTGSLLALASALPRLHADAATAPLARAIEDALRREFDFACHLLLDQRRVDVGTPPFVGLVAFEASHVHPGIARVAWASLEAGAVRWRDALALGSWSEGPAFRPIDTWAALEVGEYLGPRVRVAACVDQAAWQRTRDLRAGAVQGEASGDPVEACVRFFVALAAALGLSHAVPVLPERAAALPAHPLDYTRVVRMVRGMIAALPLAAATR